MKTLLLQLLYSFNDVVDDDIGFATADVLIFLVMFNVVLFCCGSADVRRICLCWSSSYGYYCP